MVAEGTFRGLSVHQRPWNAGLFEGSHEGPEFEGVTGSGDPNPLYFRGAAISPKLFERCFAINFPEYSVGLPGQEALVIAIKKLASKRVKASKHPQDAAEPSLAHRPLATLRGEWHDLKALHARKLCSSLKFKAFCFFTCFLQF